MEETLGPRTVLLNHQTKTLAPAEEQDGQVLYSTDAVLSNSWSQPATPRYEKVLAPALWGYIVACEYLSQDVVTRVLALGCSSIESASSTVYASRLLSQRQTTCGNTGPLLHDQG